MGKNFYQEGWKARLRGDSRAPVLNEAVREVMSFNTPVGSDRFKVICEQFLCGYDDATDEVRRKSLDN